MGLKIILIAGLGSLLAFEFGPLGGTERPDVEVSGALYPFTVPSGLKEGYIGDNPQILSAQSMWEFRMRNNSPKDITNLQFDLPFSGSYFLQDGNAPHQSGIMNFNNRIKIEKLFPGQYLVLTLWAGEKPDPQLQEKISASSAEGALYVEFPVEASSFVAWLDHYKVPISLSLIVLVLAVFL